MGPKKISNEESSYNREFNEQSRLARDIAGLEWREARDAAAATAAAAAANFFNAVDSQSVAVANSVVGTSNNGGTNPTGASGSSHGAASSSTANASAQPTAKQLPRCTRCATIHKGCDRRRPCGRCIGTIHESSCV